MKHKLSVNELAFLKKIAEQDCIIKNDCVSKDGVPTAISWNSLIARGYCKTSKVLSGPLGCWTGEFFIMPTEAGRTIVEHIIASEVPIAVVVCKPEKKENTQ